MARRDRRTRPRYSLTAGAEVLQASGAIIGATVAEHLRAQPWQEEAWGYFHSVPELHYGATFSGSLLARADIVVEIPATDGTWIPGVDEAGAPMNPAALIARDALIDLGSMDRLLRTYGVADVVVGESYLIGTFGAPGWKLYSTNEVRYTDGWTIKDLSGTPQPVAPDTTVVRLWNPDPTFREAAMSPVRSLLDVLSQIRALTDAITAAGISRSFVGLLRIPEELGDPKPFGVAIGTDDAHPLQQQLIDIISIGIRESRSAARWAPFVLPIPSDMPADALSLVPLNHGLQDFPAAELLEAAVNRFARGMPLPVEVILGHQATTFSNAEQIARSLQRDHVEPTLDRFCDDLTAGYLSPILDAAGQPGAARYSFAMPDALEADVQKLALATKALVDAGFDPAGTLEAVGLPDIAHTGVIVAPGNPVPGSQDVVAPVG